MPWSSRRRAPLNNAGGCPPGRPSAAADREEGDGSPSPFFFARSRAPVLCALGGRKCFDDRQNRDPSPPPPPFRRSEEHTSELQSLMRISYAVFCLKKKTTQKTQ